MHSKYGDNDPAIDAGTPDTTGLRLPEFDLTGRKRINGNAVDIGALEYHESSSVVKPIFLRNNVQTFGSNTNDYIIYSLTGQKVAVFKGDQSFQSVQELVRNKYSSGIYFVTLKNMGKQVWSRSVFVK